MKKIMFISIAWLITGLGNADAQEQNKKIKRISINEYNFLYGFSREKNNVSNLEDFKKLVPSTSMVNSSMDGFSTNYSSSYYSSKMISCLLGIEFFDQERKYYKTNPLLRVGFQLFSHTALSNNLIKQDRARYDTLTSAQNNPPIYVDTIAQQYYNMWYAYDQLRLDVSLLLRTNPQARFSIYGGVGIAAGVSINATTFIEYTKTRAYESEAPNNNYLGHYLYPPTYSNVPEQHLNKMNFGISVYTPIGVDFRVGNKKELLKNLHVFYEVRPSINKLTIPELRSFTRLNVQHAFGIKISLS